MIRQIPDCYLLFLCYTGAHRVTNGLSTSRQCSSFDHCACLISDGTLLRLNLLPERRGITDMASATRMRPVFTSIFLMGSVVAAGGGEDFTNNLFSDLAPYVNYLRTAPFYLLEYLLTITAWAKVC